MTRTISIITPWRGGAADLLADYRAATEGAQIITVDNASPDADAEALRELPGVYIRNETNEGFAAANNRGFMEGATGDIIVFLNSDVAGSPAWLDAVRADVREGALYGPALQQQLVAGVTLPYLEGWCVAATAQTWERLYVTVEDRNLGPWDEAAFPGPYWEDNDLCLRALACGIGLVQTAWPIQHKGGRTAGALMHHAESFAANERAYTERVLRALPAIRAAIQPTTPAQAAYLHHLSQPSDIQHHLPLLYARARGVVVELGTRSGVSTAALLAGVERYGGTVYSIDIDPRCEAVAKGHERWRFRAGSSTDAATRAANRKDRRDAPIDLLLIDTLHTHDHVAAELALWADEVRAGGTIAIHDTETFPGVRVAAEAFCAARGWPVTFVLPCNGMAVIEVPA